MNDREAKDKIIPALLEIKSRTESGSHLEQAVLSTVDGYKFDNFIGLGNSLSYLLCISKTLGEQKIKPLNRVLDDEFIIENLSDVSDVMVDIVQISTKLASKNLMIALGVMDTKENRSLIESILLGMVDECDIKDHKAALLSLVT